MKSLMKLKEMYSTPETRQHIKEYLPPEQFELLNAALNDVMGIIESPGLLEAMNLDPFLLLGFVTQTAFYIGHVIGLNSGEEKGLAAGYGLGYTDGYGAGFEAGKQD